MNPIRKNPLGRGLESLIPKNEESTPNSQKSGLLSVDITDITPNDHQPRTDFEPEALAALVESIRSKGVLQPLVLTSLDNGKFMLIAGERRWRAAALAGLRSVPAILVEKPSDNDRLELALIENTQRDDLKPLELAKAYRSLMDKCDYRQEDVAKVAGKSRSAVANTLRLLDLYKPILDALEKRLLTEGHARVFLTLDENKANTLLNAVVTGSLSVRDTEALAKRLQETKKPAIVASPDSQALCREMETFFGSKVVMKNRKKGGTIEIKYDSAEELNRIVNKLRGEEC